MTTIKVDIDAYASGYRDGKKHLEEEDLSLQQKWFAIGVRTGVIQASEAILNDKGQPNSLKDHDLPIFYSGRLYARIAIMGIDLRDNAIHQQFLKAKHEEENDG